MTTMSDVARLAGVSAKTVSRVFNEDPQVADETRERVQWAMTKLNYVPNMLARSFRSGSDAALGVAVPDIGDPFFAAVTRSIERVATSRGMAVAVSSLGDDPARERPTVEALLRRQISGLIIAPIGHDQAYLRRWQERTPMVFVDRAPTKLTAAYVVEDDFGGARMAVAHLIGQGHRRIAFLGDATIVATTRRRLDGYQDALRSHGLPVEPELICDSADAAISTALALLDRARGVTALFSSNARCTMALVPALQHAGRTDVGLVGYGDFPMADALVPGVSVIDQDPDRVGRVAVEQLLQRIESPHARFKRKTVLPVKLITRGSGERAPRGLRKRDIAASDSRLTKRLPPRIAGSDTSGSDTAGANRGQESA